VGLREMEISHPYRSQVGARRDSIDELVDMLQTVKGEIESLRSCEMSLRAALAAMCSGSRKTQRLSGERFKVKLTWPDDTWQQSTLKELWTGDPQQSATYLRIATLAPNLREVKKLEETFSGNERFLTYKEKLLSARQPATNPPTVTLELD
jgi:hypothetical protein